MLNSKETVESIKFAAALWKEPWTKAGLPGTTPTTTAPSCRGTISATNNGASIYIEAKKKPDTYQTEKGTPMWQDIRHARIPKGAGRPVQLPGPLTDMLMGYSKNQKAAKDFLRWIHSKPVYDEWFTSQQGYTCGATKEWEKHPLWDVDPVLKPFRDLPPGRLAGYAGPPNRKAAEVVSKYIIVDMYAKAIQGMPAEEAAKWAHGRGRQGLRVTSRRPSDGAERFNSAPLPSQSAPSVRVNDPRGRRHGRWLIVALFSLWTIPVFAQDLALKRVMLSSGSLGYFEYEAAVEGDATLATHGVAGAGRRRAEKPGGL